MDARAQSALLLAIVAAALAVAIVLRPARSRLFTLFAVLNGNLCVWAFGHFLASLDVAGRLPLRMTVLGEVALPATSLAFFLEFLGEAPPRGRRLLRSFIVLGSLGAVVAFTPLVAWKPRALSFAPGRVLLGLYAFATLVVVASLLYARMRRSVSGTERARLLYLFVGAALSIGLVGVDVLASSIPFPPAGNVALIVYMYFLSQTLARHRLLDLNELLGKLVVLSLLALLLATIYGLIVSWVVGVRAGRESWAGLFLFNTLVASFVVLILFEPLKTKVESTVVSLLFRERWEFLRALAAIKQRVASLIDVREVGRLILDSLHETRRVTHTSFYLLSDDGLGFRRVDFRGPPPVPHLDAATARAVVAAAAAGQKAVLIENVERRLFELRSMLPGTGEAGSAAPAPGPAEEAARLGEIGAALAAMRAGVCIPLVGGDRVLGFLNLLDDRVPEAFSSDEIAMMLELANQLAIAVENSRLYERMKERDRLAALGEMAAGLAHEIRNPLGAIKGAVQYLDPKALPDAEGELAGVILEEVDRLNAVVTQFLEYSRPLKSTFTPVDINDVLARTMKLLTGHEMPESVQVKLDLAPELPPVSCDADQLKQVFINLAINAVQAMPRGGTLVLTTRRPRAGEWHLRDDAPRYVGDQVEIRFADTGEGIAEDVRRSIFIPFYTTKKHGTGLGLAICQRVVKNHGGTIEVESKPGEGATFILRLPTHGAGPAETTPSPLAATIKPTLAQELDGTPVPEIRPVPTTAS